MELFVFKQAAHLGGKDYQRGVQKVDEKTQADPQFLKLVGLGLIVEPEASKVISTESQQERAKKLLDKLMAPPPKKAQEDADAAELAKMEAEEAEAKAKDDADAKKAHHHGKAKEDDKKKHGK